MNCYVFLIYCFRGVYIVFSDFGVILILLETEKNIYTTKRSRFKKEMQGFLGHFQNHDKDLKIKKF